LLLINTLQNYYYYYYVRLVMLHKSLKMITDLASKSKVVSCSTTSIGHGADPHFLAGDLVINLVVGCRYFLPGLQLLSQPKTSPSWLLPNYTAWWRSLKFLH